MVRPVEWLRWHAGYGLRSLRRALRGPSHERDLLVQSAKHLRDAHEAVTGVADEIADQLDRLGDGPAGDWDVNDARDWLRRSDDLRVRTEDAWAATRRGRERMRMNPRSRPGRRGEDLAPVLLPLEVVAKQMQGIGRTLVDAAEEGMPDADPGFVAGYAEMLCHGATVVRAYRCRCPGPAGGPGVRAGAAAICTNVCGPMSSGSTDG